MHSCYSFFLALTHLIEKRVIYIYVYETQVYEAQVSILKKLS